MKNIDTCKKEYLPITQLMGTKFLDKDWIDVNQYGTLKDINKGEVGMLNNIRYFVIHPNGDIVK